MILASGLLMLVLLAQFGAARVRHPNAAAVHDSIEHEGSDWLVMDYYEGGTLDDLLGRRRRLPPPVVAPLGLQLLAALTAISGRWGRRG